MDQRIIAIVDYTDLKSLHTPSTSLLFQSTSHCLGIGPSAKFIGFIALANADWPYHLARGDLRSQIEVTHVETGQRWVV